MDVYFRKGNCGGCGCGGGGVGAGGWGRGKREEKDWITSREGKEAKFEGRGNICI